MSKVIQNNKWKFDYMPTYNNFKKCENKYFELDTIVINDEHTNFKKSAILHRIIRDEIKNILVAGKKYKEVINTCDELIKLNPNSGYAFPIGISVNNVFMHDTVMSSDDEREFKKGDVVKIDIGIHIDGDIIDSAFTHIVDEQIENHYLKPLLDASLDSMYTAISLSGADARIKDISVAIQEVIESYELENGKKINSIFGFGGHNIEKYKVHGDKLVLCKPHSTQNDKFMLENEIFAIETYSSTGSGNTILDTFDKTSHFCLNHDFLKTMKRQPKKNIILDWENKTRMGLPFNKSWIENINTFKYMKEFNSAIKEGSIIGYPPVKDNDKNAYTAQFEHTIRIKKSGVEIFSLGEDY